MEKPITFFRSFLENINFATFFLAAVGALAALWLNSNYVSQEVYERDQKIIQLKIESLETETQALRFMAQTNQTEIRELLPLVEKIETLVSNFITPNGDVIITDSMKEMEVDIAEIKKDIEYMKARLWPQG
jgi:flagellar basal body-associated protein FliL